MTRRPLAFALATALAAIPGFAVAASESLTVYSGDFEAVAQSEARPGGPGFALVERRLSYLLKAGDNRVALDGLPRAADASSIVLRPFGGAQVAGQRFDFAVASQDELLRRAVGQQVEVEQSLGNERRTLTGTLLSAGNGLTLRLPDGRIQVLSDYAGFSLPRLPDGVVSEPTVVWQLAAPSAGNQDFALSYATAGLAWRAEYRIDARGLGKDCRMSLDGAAMVANRSGADFSGVRLTLVAGEPRRAPAMPAPKVFARSVEMASFAADAAAPQAQPSGEYQSYRLPNAGDLPQGSVQRLPLVDAVGGIACERRYETRYEMADWRPPFPLIDENFGAGDGQPQPVIASLRFSNAKAEGLGLPLPAGRVRMFDGADFLGEATLPHTPAGKQVALEIGNVFDLAAERSREDFKLDRAGRPMTETVAIKLTNGRASAVTVRVHERLGRWTDWEITDSSVPFEKRDAQSVSFDASVPANGAATVRYTVRYRWAPDVKIP